MTNDEFIEEILIEAYKHGMGREVIHRAEKKMKAGTERFDSFLAALKEVKEEEGWE
jgi:hypothetical protein